MTKKKLGQILLEAGALDEYQLKSALGFQKKWGGRLGSVLVDNRFITEEALVQAIHAQTGIPVVEVEGRNVPDYLLKLIPAALAEQYHIIPIGLEGEAGKPSETLVIAMSEPTNLDALDELRFKTGKKLKAVLAGDKAIEKAIALHYRGEQPPDIDFDQDPENVQFGGQEVAIDEMVVVQGTLESGPAPAGKPTTGPVADDPFAELDSLISSPAESVPPNGPAQATPVVEDPFDELDSIGAGSPHPASTALEFDLDVEEPIADPEGGAGESVEELEELEVLEELEPLAPGDKPPGPSESAGLPPPPPPSGERDLSLFGDAAPDPLDVSPASASPSTQETVGTLESVPPMEELPDLDQPADLSGVPDLEPAPEPSAPVEDTESDQGTSDSPDPDPQGEPAPPADGAFEFDLDGDDLDLDAILDPISPPDGTPPPGEPAAPEEAAAPGEPAAPEEAAAPGEPAAPGDSAAPEEPAAPVEPAESDEDKTPIPTGDGNPGQGEKTPKSAAMTALLSRVGLHGKKDDAEPPSPSALAEQSGDSAGANPELPAGEEASSTGESPARGLNITDPQMAALVDLLIRKGVLSEEEIAAALDLP